MNTHDMWFGIILIIALILFITLFIANAYYWNKLRGSGSVNVSASQANMMFWLNVIWIFVATIILIWTLIRMFIKPKPNTLELAKGMTNVPPVVVLPTEQQPLLQPAPQPIFQQVPQQTVLQPGQQYVTSAGQPGNTITFAGQEAIRSESMYV
jgi:magnesium-transporting ATPase (P-type)